MEPSNPALSRRRTDEIIEVKLWEIYLLYHPCRLYQILTKYSLDYGPIECDHSGRVVFRFREEDWTNQIKQLLYQHRIPVVIQSNRLNALRSSGRETVLR